jgi:hypothetical protein
MNVVGPEQRANPLGVPDKPKQYDGQVGGVDSQRAWNYCDFGTPGLW